MILQLKSMMPMIQLVQKVTNLFSKILTRKIAQLTNVLLCTKDVKKNSMLLNGNTFIFKNSKMERNSNFWQLTTIQKDGDNPFAWNAKMITCILIRTILLFTKEKCHQRVNSNGWLFSLEWFWLLSLSLLVFASVTSMSRKLSKRRDQINWGKN
mgnify:CR=1 FL=1